MKKNHTCKILAVGIIVLFIGVGIHPAFAVDTSKSKIFNEPVQDFELFLAIWVLRGPISNLNYEDNYIEFDAKRVVDFKFIIFRGFPIPIVSREIIENQGYSFYLNDYMYTGFIRENYIFIIIHIFNTSRFIGDY